MQLYISGNWQNTEESMPVNNPFDGSVLDEVSIAGPDKVEKLSLARCPGRKCPIGAVAKSSPMLPVA
jgi:acyl-CoA reductase-like NAD-dependent aldehyde dehydrogenase